MSWPGKGRGLLKIESDQAPRTEGPDSVRAYDAVFPHAPDADHVYCDRCDLLVGLTGFHVADVTEHQTKRATVLWVVIESPPPEEGCPVCGVIAHRHGRREVRLVDVPCMARPVELAWRKRTWRCPEPACAGGVFTEQHDDLAKPRALQTTRACR